MADQEALVSAKQLLARGDIAWDRSDMESAAYAYRMGIAFVEALLNEYDLATAPEELMRVAFRLYHGLGSVRYLEEDLRAAAVLFERALMVSVALDPESYETGVRHHNLALIREQLGDGEKALEHYEAALEIFDARAKASAVQASTLETVGRLSLETGQREKGLQHLDAFRELAPVAYSTPQEAAAHLRSAAEVLAAHGEPDRARACLDKAAELTGRS